LAGASALVSGRLHAQRPQRASCRAQHASAMFAARRIEQARAPGSPLWLQTRLAWTP
jgi:hypothetical protein